MDVERQITGLKLGSGSEPALELPWWKRGICRMISLNDVDTVTLHDIIKTLVFV